MTEQRIVAVIQARMTSSRLPGKVLMELGDQPNLLWMVNRVRRAKSVDALVIATTTDASDNPIAEFCEAHDVQCYRGSMHDVLDRVYKAAVSARADVIVRLTGDCPLIDPDLIDSNLQTFLIAAPPLDFAANRLPGNRTVPIGLDTEIATMAALKRAWQEAAQPHQREHVMPYCYDLANGFNILHILHDPDYGDYRWTLDTVVDLTLLRAIVAEFKDDKFSWLDVIDLMERKPELKKINAEIQHKSEFDVDNRA